MKATWTTTIGYVLIMCLIIAIPARVTQCVPAGNDTSPTFKSEIWPSTDPTSLYHFPPNSSEQQPSMAIRILTFENDSPCNTELFDEEGEILYTVDTVSPKSGNVTRVRNADDDILGTIEWRESLPDKVTLPGKQATPLNKWLKKSILPFVNTVSFKDGSGRKYTWKGNAPGEQLELYAEDYSSDAPIARFRQTHPGAPKVPAHLILAPRAVEIQDTVVLSFIFLEKSRRIRERASHNRADSMRNGCYAV